MPELSVFLCYSVESVVNCIFAGQNK